MIINKNTTMRTKYLSAIGIISILTAGVLMNSCTKSFDERRIAQADMSNTSVVQAYVAMVNASRNHIWIDNNRVTGTALATAGLFPATGYGFSVTGGTRAFLLRDTSATTTQIQYSFAQDLQAGKNYTMFIYDTITSPKQKTVETSILTPKDTTARLRFANFIYNTSSVVNVDVFSYLNNANVFTNVPTTDVTGFIPYQSGRTDTLYIRETGTQNLLIKQAVGPFTTKRSYTAVYRGSYKGTKAVSTLANF